MMSDLLRAVLDTNVLVAAVLSRNPTSPARELMERWQRGEFALIICDALLVEAIEVLQSHGVAHATISELIALLSALAEWTPVPDSAVEHVVAGDADDDRVVACAVLANAGYLVTHDSHFDSLGEQYRSVRIVRTLPFLWAVRGDRPTIPQR